MQPPDEEPDDGPGGDASPRAGLVGKAGKVRDHDLAANIEEKVRETRMAASRVMQFAIHQERLKQEEDLTELQEQLDAGVITEAEARMIVARQRMRARETDAAAARQSAMAGADFSSADMMLTDILGGSKPKATMTWMVFILRFFGLMWVHEAATRQKQFRASPKFVQPFPILRRIVYSSYFDLVAGLFVLANGVTIGIQTSLEKPGEEYEIAEYAFTALFVLEVILRMIVDGWSWVWNPGNFADSFLIFATGVIPMFILKPSGISSNNNLIRIFAIARVLRLVRLVRMVRMFPFFRIFWSLIQGVLDSGRTLVYTYVTITMVLYVFAIFSVYIIAEDPTLLQDRLAQLYFGDVPKAMFTLFQIITLDSWFEIARPLKQKSSVVTPFIIAVIGVVTLALLNLVVASIVNNALERGSQDDVVLAAIKREEQNREVGELKNMFLDMDTDGDAMLSKEEYDSALAEIEEVRAKFDVLEIAPNEYEGIWSLIDDGAGEVKIDRFVDLLHNLRGDAKAKDTFSIMRKVHMANKDMSRLSKRLSDYRSMAADMRAEAAQVRQQLGHLQHEMCDFISLMGKCIPTEPADLKTSHIDSFNDTLNAEVEMILLPSQVPE